MSARTASSQRKTKETNITVSLNLDGTGKSSLSTRVGFFDHMLESFARHGLFDLEISCEGDLHVDAHHTIEDVGIVLGDALKTALGKKEGIKRYGSCTLPMDEALVLCAVDLSGRPFFVEDLRFSGEMMGDMPTQMVREFFYAVSYSAGMNLHFCQHRGNNDHHIAECAFKAFAKALDAATQPEPRIAEAWSTKGVL
ncbi:MAG: imidazoleglycerol-phosphate dehydratase HisB [Oscillospiraceae bacterium]|nr:imidazoleglycerol-phosphate dehydratase HisB [Oscillospiraceae bacterium]